MAPSNQTAKWQRSHPQDPSQPCYLLTLLPELRLHILSLLLARPDPLILTRGLLKQITYRDRDEMKDELLDRWFTVEDLAVMLTCKQLHAEAASVLYSQNTFLLNDTVSIQHRYYCFSQTRHLNPFIAPRYTPFIRQICTRPVYGAKQNLYSTAVALSQLLSQWPGVMLVTLQLSPATLAFVWKVLGEIGRETAVTRLAVEMRTMLFMHGIKLAKGFTMMVDVESGREEEGEEEESSVEVLREVRGVVREAVETARGMRRRLL